MAEEGGKPPFKRASPLSYAILPIGYPMGRFGLVRRILDNVEYEDRWGQPYQGL